VVNVIVMSLKDISGSETVELHDGDVEQLAGLAGDTSYLNNSVVKTLEWRNVDVVVPDRETKKTKQILTSVSGHVAAGKLLPKVNTGCIYLIIGRLQVR
jgi:hypothetical protein